MHNSVNTKLLYSQANELKEALRTEIILILRLSTTILGTSAQ